MSAIGPEPIYSVALRVTGAAASVQRAAIAAVPRRFRLIDGHAGDVVVIEPSSGVWPEFVDEAIREGARGVLVAGRAPGRPGVARATLEHAAAVGVPVMVHAAYAMAVAWRSVVAEVVTDTAGASLLDSVVTWPVGATDQVAAARRALLDQLAVVRPLIGDGSDLRTIHGSVGGYEIIGDRRPVTTLTGVAAPVGDERLDLDVVSAGPHWRVRFDTGAPARPVTIERMDGGGIRSRPLRFESSARACWVALYEQLSGLAPVEVDRAFLADLDIVDHLLPTT